eukprot:5112016-Pyramimonas_sp.AAC.1
MHALDEAAHAGYCVVRDRLGRHRNCVEHQRVPVRHHERRREDVRRWRLHLSDLRPVAVGLQVAEAQGDLRLPSVLLVECEGLARLGRLAPSHAGFAPRRPRE